VSTIQQSRQTPLNDRAPTTTSRAERRRLERARARSLPRRRSGATRPFWRSPIVLVSGLAIAAAIGLILMLAPSRPEGSASLVAPTTTYPAGTTVGEAIGRSDAPVTLEIWSDFQCPFCGQLARTYLPQLRSEFVAAGQLRIVPRDVAFVGRGGDNESISAAVAASCAGDQGKYWQFHDQLFWNQQGENQGAFSAARLQQLAGAVGLDRGSWDACRADPKRAQDVAATTSAAADAGIASTPTLVLNGEVSAGVPRSWDDLANAIRRLVSSAGAE
jgi:protein-disulfide isomerase